MNQHERAADTGTKCVYYIYRGHVERGNGHGYDWHDGYSPNTDDGSMTAPWMTMSECREEARSKGVRACFDRPVWHKTEDKR